MKPETELQKRIQDSRSETEIQSGIMEALKAINVWAIRVGRNKRRNKRAKVAPSGEDGSPDIWTELGWMEVKRPGEGLDPDQEEWHAKAEARGVRSGVVHSETEALALAAVWRTLQQEPLLRGMPGLFSQLGRASVVRKP